MKKLRQSILVVLIALIALPFASAAWGQECKNTTIRGLLADPEGWLHISVCVEGWVKEMVSLPTQPSFVWYELQDEHNNSIWVKRERGQGVDPYPPQNEKILVEAEVVFNTSPEIPTADIILIERPRVAVTRQAIPEGQGLLGWLGDNPLLAVLLVVFFLLFAALILVLLVPMMSRRKALRAAPPAVTAADPTVVAGPPGGAGPVGGGPVGELATPVYQGPEIQGDVMTPVYFGHVTVDECSDGSLMGKSYDLAFPANKPEAVLGRGSQADIRLKFKFLSRKHVGIQQRDGQLLARRLPRSQPVSVDDNPLAENESAVLQDGSVLGLPGMALRVHFG